MQGETMNVKKIFFTILIIFFSLTIIKATDLNDQEKEWLSKAFRYDKNGWIFLHIEGEPFERGFQRGYLTAAEIEDLKKTLAHLTKYETGRDIEFFLKTAVDLFKNKVSPEYVEEMKGMAAGAKRAGKNITYEDILLMNGFIDILWHWFPQQKEKESLPSKPGPGCSAFIATGDATSDGKIVMAHNSWYHYALLRFCNVIVDIIPKKGHRILMQSWGPSIYSGTDFFITAAGLVGTETTIADFKGFNEEGTPVFERARKAMQYANNIDEWVNIMIENNNGAYANSWLIGNINTNEIARLELGLKHHRFERKKNGYFIGSNVPDSLEILRDETAGVWDDVRDFKISRRVRWKQLMKQYYGKINVEVAKKMLADHYDVYLKKEIPTCRTICGHWELDDGMVPGTLSAFYPGGAIDGKVLDATLAKNWSMWAKWGHSCDLGFNAAEFIEKNPQYDYLEGFLKDLPPQPWTLFTADNIKEINKN
jgi:hypothetical protein